MADRKYYVICDAGCKFESMTREQILTAIMQAVNEGTISDIDAGFVQTIKTINGKQVKFFVGQQSEYEKLSDEEKTNLFALITNDTTKEAFLEAIEGIAKDLQGLKDNLATGLFEVASAGYAKSARTCANADYASNANNAEKAKNAEYAQSAGTSSSASYADTAGKFYPFNTEWTKYNGENIAEGIYLVRTYMSEAKGPIYASTLLDTGKIQDRCVSGIMQPLEQPLRVLATYKGNNVYTLELQRYTSAWAGYPEREYDFEYKQIHKYNFL